MFFFFVFGCCCFLVMLVVFGFYETMADGFSSASI